MEITLEKIELVKDRTGVSYKEAKEALEAAEGSVVDAIIAIEETINLKGNSKASEFADETVEKVKELVKKGNVTKITVKRDGETILNVPVTVGILGTLVAPWGVIAAAVASFGFRCTIEVTKDDGTVINVSQKAENLASDVKEKGSVVAEEVAAKGASIYDDVKEKTPEVMNDIKEKSADAYKAVAGKAAGLWSTLKEKKNNAAQKFEDAFDVDEVFDTAEEKVEEFVDDAEEVNKED